MSLLSPQLQAFMMIAAYKTVHSAADMLHITQTAVTQRIRILEGSLGTTLFIRTRRGMKLTTEGEALLRYCHAAQALEGEALASIKGAGVESEIQICISGPTSVMRSRIMPACLKVLANFPKLMLHFDITDTEERDKALKAGHCQLAIISPEQVASEMQSKLLKPEKYILVACPKWQKRRLQAIVQQEYIIDFNPADQMTFNYLKHFKLKKPQNIKRHFVNRTESLAAMVAAGYGYGVLTEEFSKSYLDDQQLIVLNAGKTYENTLALAWYHRPEPPPYFSALVIAISDY